MAWTGGFSLCLLLPLLPLSLAEPDDAAPHQRALRFVYEVENQGDKPLRRLELRLVLPPELPRQKHLRLDVQRGTELVPGPKGGTWRLRAPAVLKRDPYGNRVAVFRCKKLAPGHRFVAQWYGEFLLLTTKRQRLAQPLTLSRKERVRYLRDAPRYQTKSPVIRRYAKKLAAQPQEGLDLLRAIQSLVMDRMKYERAGGWDPAPLCLQRGTGSCSEYSFAFISLCRAMGIPARWSGGLALRKSERSLYVDKVFHRWAEAWLPEYGWVPVDASRDDGEERDGKRRPSTLGTLQWPLLILARGDGVDALTGWSYHCSGKWAGKGGKSRRRGYWAKLRLPKDEREPTKPGRRHPAAQRQRMLFESGAGHVDAPQRPGMKPKTKLGPDKAKTPR
ncbi:MAG: hypothetical protein CSA62_01275 [Planctomycetota bacterium]|nr:MAG: hypothetical protein CSA62_01275 [Planctomycetota bacterium]